MLKTPSEKTIILNDSKIGAKNQIFENFSTKLSKRYSDTFFPYSINETIIAAKVGEPSPIRKKGDA